MSTTNQPDKKRWPGYLLVVVGGLGVAACLACAIVLWIVQSRIATAVDQTFDSVGVALARLEDRTEQANERISGVKDSLHDLNHRVQQRTAERQEINIADAADIDELERRLRARFAQIQSWIEFTQLTVELVQQLLGMLEASSAFLQDDSRNMDELVATIRSGREEVDLASQLFDEVQLGLVEIRAQRNVKENAEKITSISSRIGDSVTKIESYGQRFETSLHDCTARVANMGERIQGQIRLFTAIVSLLIAWMALGQGALIELGRRSLR